MCAGRCPNTRSPSSEALLKLLTKSGPLPGEVADRLRYRAPYAAAWDPRALHSPRRLLPPLETRPQDRGPPPGRSHLALIGL